MAPRVGMSSDGKNARRSIAWRRNAQKEREAVAGDEQRRSRRPSKELVQSKHKPDGAVRLLQVREKGLANRIGVSANDDADCVKDKRGHTSTFATIGRPDAGCQRVPFPVGRR